MTKTKENIYDEQISPLMQQVIDICREHKIAMVFSAHLPDEEQDSLYCTTLLPGDNDEPNPKFTATAKMIRGDRPSIGLGIRTTHADGSQTLTAII